MATDASLERNTRWVQALDRILEVLNLDVEHPIRFLQIEDGREVIIVQPNAFTVSRVYATGRPDGLRPHGEDSYYAYFCAKLAEHEEEHGTRDGFELEPEEWQLLFEESFFRYNRYLLFAGIKRWEDVKRDTDTNIAVTTMARTYAPPEIAWQSYQYKGYMLMMNSIAEAELSLQQDNTAEALRHIDAGIQKMGEFCGECLREEHPDAENVTRERYLSNLLEYRADLEALSSSENPANQEPEADDAEIDSDSDEADILAELERLLSEEDESPP